MEKKITEAQKTKEENIGKTISDREALIGEAVKNDELFLATRDTIDYLKGMQELNQLDTESARKLEDYEALAKNSKIAEWILRKEYTRLPRIQKLKKDFLRSKKKKFQKRKTIMKKGIRSKH